MALIGLTVEAWLSTDVARSFNVPVISARGVAEVARGVIDGARGVASGVTSKSGVATELGVGGGSCESKVTDVREEREARGFFSTGAADLFLFNGDDDRFVGDVDSRARLALDDI